MATSHSTSLLDAVDSFNDAHERWASDEHSSADPTNSSGYTSAVAQLFASLDAGGIPAEHRALEVAALTFKNAWLQYLDSGRREPTDSQWASREAIVRERTRQIPHIESVQELDRQKVPHEQIARIWGLIKPNGGGDVDAVIRELAAPGTVIGADYVHPSRRGEQRELERQRDALRVQIASLGDFNADTATATDDAPPACPETSWELWRQGVPIQQAAKMLRRSASEMRAEWDTFDLQQREKELAEAKKSAPALAEA
ncbi:MAG: hypothetical protein AB7O38_26600 [Pirellulaceae bacterium]